MRILIRHKVVIYFNCEKDVNQIVANQDACLAKASEFLLALTPSHKWGRQ